MQAARVICYVQSVVVRHSSLVLAIVIVTLTCRYAVSCFFVLVVYILVGYK